MPQDPSYPPDLPLTEVTFFILLSLSNSPRHGYGLMKDVRMLSQNRLRLGTGTLYGALKRLLDLGWILRVEENEHSTARSRKLYQLTLLGRSILTAEIHRLEGLVSAAQLRSTKVAPTLDGLS